MTDHKYSIAFDLFAVIALAICLVHEGRISGAIIYLSCDVNPFFECLDLLLYCMLPVLIGRITLLVYYMRARDRSVIQNQVNESFFVLQLFQMASFGYWTLSNFMRLLSRHNMKCLSRLPFSKMKLAYQICLVSGGFPAIMCLCAMTFLAASLPFIAYDYYRHYRDEREKKQRRIKLKKTLFRCSYEEVRLAFPPGESTSYDCCICINGLDSEPTDRGEESEQEKKEKLNDSLEVIDE